MISKSDQQGYRQEVEVSANLDYRKSAQISRLREHATVTPCFKTKSKDKIGSEREAKTTDMEPSPKEGESGCCYSKEGGASTSIPLLPSNN